MVAPSNQLPPSTQTTTGASSTAHSVAASAQSAAHSVASSAQSAVNQVKSAVKWDSRYAGAVPHDTSYYAKCLLGGVLACGLTHTAICPLDVTKCNMQVCSSFSRR